MIDLSAQLQGLARRFEAASRPSGRGRVVAFMSAHDDDMRAAVSRMFAGLVARSATRDVWLVDLDLFGNRHHSAFAAGGAAEAWGPLTGSYDASLGCEPFWSVADGEGAPVIDERRYVSLQKVGERKLYVSRFHSGGVRKGWKVKIRDVGEYWRAVRQAAELVVVDAPARVRSEAGLAVARRMDAIILVVENDGPGLIAGRDLRAEIEARGGRCEGAVLVDPRAKASKRKAA